MSEKKTSYYKDGSVSYEQYFIDGKRHRVDGPAYIEYRKDGSVSYESYYIDDKRHRVDGPAYVSYDEGGSAWYENHFIDGERYTKEKHRQEIKEIKKLDKANQLLDPRAWVRELGRTS